MRNKSKYSIGLISFCERKQLNLTDTVNRFLQANNLPFTNKQSIIDANWKKFAAFVNEGLQKGDLKGVNISTSNGSEEEKVQRRRLFNQYPEDLKSWWKVLNSAAEWNTGKEPLLAKFFHLNGLGHLPAKDYSHDLQIGKNSTRFEVIKNAGLLDSFKEYCNINKEREA